MFSRDVAYLSFFTIVLLAGCQQEVKNYTPVLSAGGGRFYSPSCLRERTTKGEAGCRVGSGSGGHTVSRGVSDSGSASSGPIFLFHGSNFDSSTLCKMFSKTGDCSNVISDGVQASPKCSAEAIAKEILTSGDALNLVECGQIVSGVDAIGNMPNDDGFVSRLVYRPDGQAYDLEMFMESSRQILKTSFENAANTISGAAPGKQISQSQFVELDYRAKQVVNSPLTYATKACGSTGAVVQYRVNKGAKIILAKRGDCVLAQVDSEDAKRAVAIMDEIAGPVPTYVAPSGTGDESED